MARKPAETTTTTNLDGGPVTAVPTDRVRRIFTHGAQRLADPNPAVSALEAKRVLAATYPELASASLHLTKTEEINGTKVEHWELRRSVGTKG